MPFFNSLHTYSKLKISVILFLLFLIVTYIKNYFYIYCQNKKFERTSDYFTKAKLSELKSNNKLKIPLQKKNKILIITFDNRKEDYIIAHNNNLKKYSKKWNIDYKFYDKCDKNVYWCKIYLVLDALKSNKYDFVMWLDSDTYIKNMNINLSDILNQYTSDILIGSDNKFYDLINAGVFIIKNSKIGKKFLKECISSLHYSCINSDGTLNGRWAGICYEQGIMNLLIANKYRKYTTILSNDIILNNKECNNNVFILHLYGQKTDSNYIKKIDKCFI